jgi:GNAT superfamily N-acetyltransferase
VGPIVRDGGSGMTAAVRCARAEDIEPLARVMARAFREDPMHRWIFPGEASWARNSHRSFAIAMRQELKRGTVFVDDAGRGAIIWHAPGLVRPLAERVAFALRMLPLLGTRALAIGGGFDQLEKLHPAEAHWYLYAVGTDPAHQGKGIGSALIRPILARCDEEGVPAWLEASRPDNVPYYQRFGFEVRETFTLPKGPPVWCMLRRPAGPPAEPGGTRNPA